MRFETFLGFRFLQSTRRPSFLSLVTWISVSSIAIGVAALLVVFALMSGFETELERFLVGIHAHITVRERNGGLFLKEEGRASSGLKDAIKIEAPLFYSEAMLVHAGKGVGVAVEAMDGEDFKKIDLLKLGKWDGDMDISDPSHLVLGVRLAETLGVKVGDTVHCVVLQKQKEKDFSRKIAAFQVSGIFSLGMYDFDSRIVFIPHSRAESLFNLQGRVNAIKIWLKDVSHSQGMTKYLNENLASSLIAVDWYTLNHNFFELIALEKWVVVVILFCIVMVAAGNLVGALLMIVIRKRREIAILRAMGAGAKQIMRVFIIEGFCIGGVGTGVGLLLGVLVVAGMDRFKWIQLPPEIYFFSHLPMKLKGGEVFLVLGVSLLLSFISTLYPARRAIRSWPAYGIHD